MTTVAGLSKLGRNQQQSRCHLLAMHEEEGDVGFVADSVDKEKESK